MRVRLTRENHAIYLLNTEPLFCPLNVRKARVDCISKTLVFYSSYKVSPLLIIFFFLFPLTQHTEDSGDFYRIKGGEQVETLRNPVQESETTGSAGHSSDPGLATSWLGIMVSSFSSCLSLYYRKAWVDNVTWKSWDIFRARRMLDKLD